VDHFGRMAVLESRLPVWVIRFVLTVGSSLPVFPGNGHPQTRSACLKGAMTRHAQQFTFNFRPRRVDRGHSLDFEP
jgi:hypothetical protein